MDQYQLRHFLTYTGISLPFKLVNPLGPEEVENRNTFFKGYFDEADRLMGFDKMVYGEVEQAHRYAYHGNGTLMRAEITDIDGDTSILEFADPDSPA